jgi:hypothetical protein
LQHFPSLHFNLPSAICNPLSTAGSGSLFPVIPFPAEEVAKFTGLDPKAPPEGRSITPASAAGDAERVRVAAQGGPVQRELNILALMKGNDRYVFVYDDESREALIDVFRDCAADPRMNFSWFDAALLTQKAREQAPGQAASRPAGRYE